MKIVIILFIVAIVGSLGSALFYLMTDKGKSKRTVHALAIRVGLSMTLFLMLMAGHYFGLISRKSRLRSQHSTVHSSYPDWTSIR